MIEIYAKEYVAVVKHLLKTKTGKITIRQQNLAVEKTQALQLLERNLYEEPAKKLRQWKGLKWIQADKGHMTKRVYLETEKKYKRMILFDIEVYSVLKQLTPQK